MKQSQPPVKEDKPKKVANIFDEDEENENKEVVKDAGALADLKPKLGRRRAQQKKVDLFEDD